MYVTALMMMVTTASICSCLFFGALLHAKCPGQPSQRHFNSSSHNPHTSRSAERYASVCLYVLNLITSFAGPIRPFLGAHNTGSGASALQGSLSAIGTAITIQDGQVRFQALQLWYLHIWNLESAAQDDMHQFGLLHN